MKLQNILMDTLSSFLLKARELIHVNTEYLQNSKESISSLNRWCEKIKSYSIDDEFDIIRLREKIQNNSLREPNIFQSFLDENTITSYQMCYRYYNPLSKSMSEYGRITEFKHIIRCNYNYIRDMLGLKNISPMRLGELSLESRLWRNFKRLSDNILDRMSQKWTQCLVHIVTFQSKNGMSFVYGSIFVLVKLGFYTVVWFKFTPGEPHIQPEDLFPTSCDVFLNEKSFVPGYSKVIFQETKDITQIVVSAFNVQPFDEMGFQVETDNYIPDRKWRVAVGLAIMIGFSLSIGVLPDFQDILQY